MRMTFPGLLTATLMSLLASGAEPPPAQSRPNVFASAADAGAMLMRYFETMCEPKPFLLRSGADFKAHQRALREKLLACAGLWPLPDRVALAPHASEPLDHDWCTVRRVAYQLWPQVCNTGLLYMPKQFAERPAPAVLSPHGHWDDGNADPQVQARCLVLAKLGYVVFSPTQVHAEDPLLGISYQTLMIWSNIRALDLLESMPEVDKTRLGVTGESGGGLQTQMLLAVDDRVKAATIVGMTCDYREILFAWASHCSCNHFPGIMRHTDGPELSALGLPCAVQFLTMNDWTRNFEQNNFPTIRRLYELNGAAGRSDCRYEPVEHSYNKSQRERMYGWMEKWLRGRGDGRSVPEPPVNLLPVKTLVNLKADATGDKGFKHLSELLAGKHHYVAPPITGRQQWRAYRDRQRAALRDLLGEPVPTRQATARLVGSEQRDGLTIERLLCPSEANILVPVLLLRPSAASDRLPVIIHCDERGKDAALASVGETSPCALARKGALVALPDVRFIGELSLRTLNGSSRGPLTFKPCDPLKEGPLDWLDYVWQRNAMLWGRPIPGMAASDLRAVVTHLAARPDADANSISLTARDTLAPAALFAAALDDRIGRLDIDLKGKCFETRDLPLVPFVLRHGDVLQWSALLATRRLTLAGVPSKAGDLAWLREVFRVNGNADGLCVLKNE